MKLKTFGFPNSKSRSYTVSDFGGGLNGGVNESILPARYAVTAYNFNSESGVLEDGYGVAQLTLPLSNSVKTPVFATGITPLQLFYYRRHDYVSDAEDGRLLAYCSDKYIYELKLFDSVALFAKIPELYFENAPVGVNYKYNGDDCFLFSYNSTLYIYSGDEIAVAYNVPDITSMCIHYERLFATTGSEGTSLWFSDDFDPANWEISLEEAGFIDLQDEQGKLLKVVSFLDYLYIFRSYGITRVTAYGNQSEYYVHKLYTGTGKIYGKSIIECGDRIVYLASDGLYMFDGVNASRVLEGYDRYLSGNDNSGATGEFLDGKLFMRLRMTVEGTAQNVLLVYRPTSGDAYIIKGIECGALAAIRASYQKLCLIVNGRTAQLSADGKFFGTAFGKKWRTPEIDFGLPNKTKVLRRVSANVKGSARITVISDCGQKTYSFSNSVSQARTELRGRSFVFEIASDTPQTVISKPTVSVEYV